MADLANVRVIQQPGDGSARAWNAAARAAGDCDHLVFVSGARTPTTGWLDVLLEELEADDRTAAVTPKLVLPSGQLAHAGVTIGQDGLPHHLYRGLDATHPAANRPRAVAAATLECVLIRRGDFEALGGFDPAFADGYEAVDFCLRLGERGRVIRYCPRGVVHHTGAGLASLAPTAPSARLYAERWRATAAPDDMRHYLEDGLMTLTYGQSYPLTFQLAPELAAVRTPDAEISRLLELLQRRSAQVIELLDGAGIGRPGATSALGWRTFDDAAPPAVEQICQGREHRLGHGGRRLVSVVIPVKDGARHLSELLPAVLGQSISTRLEIVAIDSGSQDDSVGLLRRYGSTVLRIEPAGFDHGITRRLAAERARGEVLVFLTQSARPIGDRWLAPLIASLEGDPEVVGVCSRVVPHREADILTRRDVEREPSGSARRQRKQIADWDAYRRVAPNERRAFLNFHTVSAAIRAETLRSIPFRSVRTIGEDLQWAREALESGWALVHEPASRVHHSHTYALGELFARNVDDGIANRDINGQSMGAEELVPSIRAAVRDDFSYLRDTLGLGGSELRHWELESVLRRTAQVAGQWLGINYQTLPDGAAAHFSSVVRARAGVPPIEVGAG
jgi:rhamnosyltransferase